MKKAVILLSGGLDSTTCLAYAKSKGFECYTLSINYGQKQAIELEYAKAISKHFNAKRHEIVTLSIGNFGGSALTDSTIEVPEYQQHKDIPITYVGARNTIFLSIALGFAEMIEAHAIFIGVSAVDYSGYPDCRPEYIKSFQQTANLATKVAVEGNPIEIITPLIALSKADTIKMGLALGVDYSLTISCYQATSMGYACGKCGSCHFRKKGFLDAGVVDPTKYVN